jgi:uncharacterized protein (UPF0332 family)
VNPDNVLEEFERAQRALRAAQILHANDLFEDAVSRSYYAMMHAAKAALLVHDVIAESHAVVRRLFGSVLVRPDLIEREWASVLARVQDQRIAADYSIGMGWDAEAALHLVEDAQAFLRRVRSYLRSVGIAVEE